uniref:Uncharacterized protein n=1 Tax=Candidatus Kentrum sp. TUN TaxID=2126343 RepID=A0A450ZPM0_9GAMM|nr:MAG: hypothetical protein BECKTUN1418D_GA0071000_103713 [Candidatus Kentron sp. TUN]VFK60124.1 MAG: hypothetical protein BECKTUN1418F_GA0071002_12007 [Candidatus Kentron sp. TUN]VFK69554.1 MAG: hypothetical protein BECKTUN1418E_GA0071001_11981 [Candidatus Kentron sp. TUN]
MVLHGEGGNAAQDHQFDEQDAVIGGQPHEPEVFLVPLDLVLPQQDLLHDGEKILAIEDLDLFLYGEFDVHGGVILTVIDPGVDRVEGCGFSCSHVVRGNIYLDVSMVGCAGTS